MVTKKSKSDASKDQPAKKAAPKKEAKAAKPVEAKSEKVAAKAVEPNPEQSNSAAKPLHRMGRPSNSFLSQNPPPKMRPGR